MVATTSIPTDVFQTLYPGAGRGLTPRIEANGDCLIIRGVLIQGRPHDVRVWRYNSEGKTIVTDDQTGFLRQTILDVQAAAQDLFSKQNVGDRPEGIKFFYSDIDPADPKCILQKGDVKGRVQSQEVVNTMRQIHSLFFHRLATAWSPTESPILFPKLVKKELPAPAPKKMSPNLAPTPASTSSKSPQQSSSPVLAPANKIGSPLKATLEDASNTYSKGTFLKGISYGALEQYSANPKPQGTDSIDRAYRAYTAVLANPDAKGADLDEMREWLSHHYQAVYRQYQTDLETEWKKNNEGKAFNEWCAHYAARSVAGFIHVPGVASDALAGSLQNPPQPTQKKSWFWPFK